MGMILSRWRDGRSPSPSPPQLWRGGLRGGLVALLWATLVMTVVAAPLLQGSETVHVVQAGETLFGIARQYGVTVDAIIAANGLPDPDHIEVGQRLVIPATGDSSFAARPAQALDYAVQPGDTLALIARRYGATVEGLAQWNHLTNPNLIYVGQRLLVPTSGVDGTSTNSEQTGAGQVYVVQPEDTIARIAARHGLSVWAVAQANQIANPNVIYVGQRLLIPTVEGASTLPLPFLELEILPAVAVQGRTVQVFAETDGELSLSGQFDGRPLFFVGGEGHYRTLIGIPAMASPGPYPLDLKAVRGEQEASLHSMLYVAGAGFGVQYITLSPDKAQLLDPELVAQEARRVQEVTAQATLPGLWQGTFGLPVAGNPTISAPFGIRRSYNGGPATSYHAGVDYSVGEGEPIYCPARGRVVLAEALRVRGNAVIVDHGRGVMSGYWHLSRIDVAVGQTVEPGDVLGAVGSTGLSTGAHLHWEIRVLGVPVDPLQWVQEQIQA